MYYYVVVVVMLSHTPQLNEPYEPYMGWRVRVKYNFPQS